MRNTYDGIARGVGNGGWACIYHGSTVTVKEIGVVLDLAGHVLATMTVWRCLEGHGRYEEDEGVDNAGNTMTENECMRVRIR